MAEFHLVSKYDSGDTVYIARVVSLGKYEVIKRTIDEVVIEKNGTFRYKLFGANGQRPTRPLFANSSYKEEALFKTEAEAQAEAERRAVEYIERHRERLQKEIADKRAAMNDVIDRIRADYQEEIDELKDGLKKLKGKL